MPTRRLLLAVALLAAGCSGDTNASQRVNELEKQLQQEQADSARLQQQLEASTAREPTNTEAPAAADVGAQTTDSTSVLVTPPDDRSTVLLIDGGAGASKLPSLAFQMGLRADSEITTNIPGLLKDRRYRGVLILTYNATEAVLHAVHSFVFKGGRAVIFTDDRRAPGNRRATIEDLFGISAAVEAWPLTGSPFACVSIWETFRVTVAPTSACQGGYIVFSHYLVPGPEFRDVCQVPNPQVGRDRAIAASRRIGDGEVLFIASTRQTTCTVFPFTPVDDHNIHLLQNEDAARALLSWLAAR